MTATLSTQKETLDKRLEISERSKVSTEECLSNEVANLTAELKVSILCSNQLIYLVLQLQVVNSVELLYSNHLHALSLHSNNRYLKLAGHLKSVILLSHFFV